MMKITEYIVPKQLSSRERIGKLYNKRLQKIRTFTLLDLYTNGIYFRRISCVQKKNCFDKEEKSLL